MPSKYELSIVEKGEFVPLLLGKVEGNDLSELLAKFSMVIYEILQKDFARQLDEQKKLNGINDDDIPF